MSFGATLRRHWALLLSTLLGVALLCGLGIWQLQRLHWKEAVLAQIAARLDAPATAPPDRENWERLDPDDYDYRRVRLTGTFDHAIESYLFRASATGAAGDGPGYEILTPLRLADGSAVIVNRGFVPAELRDPERRTAGQIAGETTLTGLMRRPEARNWFTPADEPDKNLWFTRDPTALAAHWGLAGVAPFSIDADAAPNPGGWPKGGATVLKIPNNHLSYALTWFALAATLLVVAVVLLKHSIRLQKPEDLNNTDI
ncbi:SURF1 family protein [uncultured Rhodoblastus sp.]|uniref:SURF1 family protein n=1 Tax=uncultured Rhodoblastus sp. TaxID=543037 RepID=UPI0025E2C493|nr:SURF1 family protein [uncultured Rhodoblastus sp.]